METQNTLPASPASHPFERAGLGRAPFRYVGPVEQDMMYGEVILNRADFEKGAPAMTTKPGGSCAYCGTYIVQMFNVRSSDGNIFHVGSDCIAKVYGETHQITRAVKKAVSKHRKAQTDARNAAKIEAVKALLASSEFLAKLSAQPSPNAARAEKLGETLSDWAVWMMAHAGTAGKLKVAKAIAPFAK